MPIKDKRRRMAFDKLWLSGSGFAIHSTPARVTPNPLVSYQPRSC